MTLHLLDAVRAEAPEAAVVVVGSLRALRAAGLAAGRRVRRRCARRTPTRSRRRAPTCSRASSPTRTACGSCAPARSTTPGRAGADLRDRLVRAPDRGRHRGGRGPRCASSPATPTRGATTPTCATSCAPTACSPSAPSRASTTSAPAAPRRPRSCSRRSGGSPAWRSTTSSTRALRRANEVMEVRGSYERLHAATGWEPRDPARADARRHGRVVARGDPRGSRGRARARVSACDTRPEFATIVQHCWVANQPQYVVGCSNFFVNGRTGSAPSPWH